MRKRFQRLCHAMAATVYPVVQCHRQADSGVYRGPKGEGMYSCVRLTRLPIAPLLLPIFYLPLWDFYLVV